MVLPSYYFFYYNTKSSSTHQNVFNSVESKNSVITKNYFVHKIGADQDLNANFYIKF